MPGPAEPAGLGAGFGRGAATGLGAIASLRFVCCCRLRDLRAVDAAL